MEDTCKAQSGGQKRKHDDLEYLDHHEGENKRQKVTEGACAGPASIKGGDIDENTGNVWNADNVQVVDEV